MDILSSNFLDKFDQMVESIHSADFIALDTEFSGLAVGYDDQSHSFD
jgi:hypothetical protein